MECSIKVWAKLKLVTSIDLHGFLNILYFNLTFLFNPHRHIIRFGILHCIQKPYVHSESYTTDKLYRYS